MNDLVQVECPFPPFMGRPLVQLAPGVWGLTRTSAVALIVEMLIAEHEGSGAVGRYLDALPKSRPVIVEAVTSSRLAGMLERRGFRYATRVDWNPTTDEWTDGFVRVGGGGSSGEPAQ